MTETEQLHQDFLKDFTKLLKKYNARFEVEDMGDGYNSHRVPCIGFNSQYDYDSGKDSFLQIAEKVKNKDARVTSVTLNRDAVGGLFSPGRTTITFVVELPELAHKNPQDPPDAL